MVVAIVLPLVACASIARSRTRVKSLSRGAGDAKEDAERANKARIDAECALSELYADFNDVTERHAIAEKALEEVKEKLVRAAAERERERANAASERANAVKTRFSMTVANARMETMKNELNDLKAKALVEGKLSEENEDLRGRCAAAEKNLLEARRSVKTLTEKNGSLTAEVHHLEVALEDAKSSEAKLETARSRNAVLTLEIESSRAELAAATHALEDAEENLRMAESNTVRATLEAEELREELVRSRAHEMELQSELKEMLETVQSLTTAQAEAGVVAPESSVTTPVEIERFLAKIAASPAYEAIALSPANDNDDEMVEVQARMEALMTRVDEAKTPGSIATALEELAQLEGKLLQRDNTREQALKSAGTTPRDVRSPDAWPISPPSPKRFDAFGEADAASPMPTAVRAPPLESVPNTPESVLQTPDAWPISPPSPVSVNREAAGVEPATPPRNLNFQGAMCEKCGEVKAAEGLARCAECHAKKQEKMASSPLQRAASSFSKKLSNITSPNKNKNASTAKKNKKKGKN